MSTPFETLEALRETYPTPMSGDQLGELLNATAWAHREEGYGVLSKESGSNCPQPVTGKKMSKDILALKSALVVDGKPKCRIFDCLIDAEGAAKPTWDEKAPVAANKWMAPVDTAPVVPDEPDTPEEPDEPDPPSSGVPYPGDAYGVQVGEVLFADYEAAGQAPNPGMGVWFLRTCWDICNPPYLSLTDSLAKHRNEWRAILGLPPL